MISETEFKGFVQAIVNEIEIRLLRDDDTLTKLKGGWELRIVAAAPSELGRGVLSVRIEFDKTERVPMYIQEEPIWIGEQRSTEHK